MRLRIPHLDLQETLWNTIHLFDLSIKKESAIREFKHKGQGKDGSEEGAAYSLFPP